MCFLEENPFKFTHTKARALAQFMYCEHCMAYVKYAYFLTYLLTRTVLEKLTDSQPVKKFPLLYGTRRVIAEFKTVHRWFLFCAKSIQSIPPSHFLKIYLNP
jgi:hypothetical protein